MTDFNSVQTIPFPSARYHFLVVPSYGKIKYPCSEKLSCDHWPDLANEMWAEVTYVSVMVIFMCNLTRLQYPIIQENTNLGVAMKVFCRYD